MPMLAFALHFPVIEMMMMMIMLMKVGREGQRGSGARPPTLSHSDSPSLCSQSSSEGNICVRLDTSLFMVSTLIPIDSLLYLYCLILDDKSLILEDSSLVFLRALFTK